MKVLIAVISNTEHPYGAMIATSMRTWDSVRVDGVETIFYVGGDTLGFKNRTLTVPVKEALNTMGHKNLHAWEWMLANREWDFMARVNASCFVHKPRLLARCGELPASGFICGGVVRSDNGAPEWMWGGHQFVMSRDVVQALVDHKEVWPHDQMDDVALSYAARDLGFEFNQNQNACSIDRMGRDEWRAVATNGEAFCFTNWEDVRKLTTQIFFRVKQDQMRHEDAVVMRHLHDQYHPYEEGTL